MTLPIFYIDPQLLPFKLNHMPGDSRSKSPHPNPGSGNRFSNTPGWKRVCMGRAFARLLLFVVSCLALAAIPVGAFGQSVSVAVDEAVALSRPIKFLENGRLQLAWVNEGALGYELFRREQLEHGSWVKVVDLNPVMESVQTYDLAVEAGPSTAFYQIRKIPDPLASLQTLDLGDGITMEFVRIPSGTFIMGSPQSETHRESDEGPLTEVTISERFLLGKYEVTQAQWEWVMGTNPSRFKGDQLPVERVSWNLAVAFCERLTERERESGRLPEGYAFTLPTEAQREYACRAGTQNRFYFGDDPDYGHLAQYAWYWTNSGSRTHPVGEKEPNAWGLYDMHGNVWEWCLDFYANAYPGGSVIDPPGPETGAVRVIRGGGWEDFARDCRSACRLRAWPGNSFSYLGFRVAVQNLK